MNTTTLTLASILVLGLVACTAETPEKTGETSDPLTLGCLSSIQAPVGSTEWHAARRRCIDEARAGRTPTKTPTPTPTPAPAPPAPTPGDDDDGGDDGAEDGADDGAGNGNSCSVSVQCVNGSCSCGSGPKQGTACDGTKRDGTDACSVVCSTCK